MKLKPDTTSYMQLALHMDGKALYLKVPTFFDATQKEWSGFVHLPKAGKTILGRGRTSKDLETNFNDELRKSFETYPEETYDLFKPLSYWAEMEE